MSVRIVKAMLWCGFGFALAGCGGQPATDSPDSAGEAPAATATDMPDGAAERPLRVMLVPADGGTEEGSLADFRPIFNAITKSHDLLFDVRVGQSYSAVVEAMAGDQVDIAWFGPVTYHQAKERGCAELLAVAVSKGESVYYSGIFCSADSEMETIQDLKGKRVAFGDVNSTSSYNYPVAMLIEGGVDPVTDLAEVHMTGSHANSLQALASGAVDAACAAFDSFAKAVEAGNIEPDKMKVLVKSDPIPYPPLAMHVKLDSEIKAKLREAFNTVHEDPGIAPEMIRGYGGKQVDRYRADFPPEEFDRAMARIAVVTDDVNAAMLEKAAER